MTIGVFAAIFNEAGEILCVKRNYGNKDWTLPGGRMESRESVFDALKREVYEETGFHVEPGELIGVYSNAYKNDLVVFFNATVLGQEPREPDGEIAEMRFCAKDSLPEPLFRGAKTRITDALNGERGVVRVFDTAPSSES